MKHLFSILILAIVPVSIFSQTISVKSFRMLPTDMDARVTYPKKDQNGDRCAIIKVVTLETGFIWDGDMLGIVSTEKKTGEYWLYIPRGSKRLTIKHNELGVLRDFIYPETIKEASVYEIILETYRETYTNNKNNSKQRLTIKATPKNASIFINNNFESWDSISKFVPPGSYHYHIAAQLYYADTGMVIVPKDKGVNLNINLKPKHGFAKISVKSNKKARIIINGSETNLVTPCTTDKLLSGEYLFTIKKVNYRKLSQKILIKDGETEELEVTLQSNRDYMRSFYKSHPFGLNIGYHTTRFNNEYFNNNLSNKRIKNGFGYSTTLNYNRFPFLLELSYFNSTFIIKDIEPFEVNSIVFHRGGEFTLNFIPFLLGINIFPYVGLGYQYSQLYTSSLTNEEIASSNTSNPIGKLGLKMRPNRLFVFAEYKKCFDFNSNGYNSSQFYCGLGVCF